MKQSTKGFAPVVILVVLALLLVVGGGIFVATRQRLSPPTTNQNTTANATSPTAAPKEGVFESIREAMSRSLSLQCEYRNDTTVTLAYIKGEKIRIDSSQNEKSQSGTIIKENKMWTWDATKKEGLIMPFRSETGQGLAVDPEKIISDLEKEKQFCHAAAFSDDIFNPPSDVKFSDLSEMMQKIPSASVPAIPR